MPGMDMGMDIFFLAWQNVRSASRVLFLAWQNCLASRHATWARVSLGRVSHEISEKARLHLPNQTLLPCKKEMVKQLVSGTMALDSNPLLGAQRAQKFFCQKLTEDKMSL